MEASTVHAPAALSRPRLTIGPRLLRLRSDEQLVTLFRSGHDEAFQVIWDRYYRRLLGYARQMLPRGTDAEDALQDVFMRAYWALHDDRRLALKAWLFRVAHNRCVDELRRPLPPPPEVLALSGPRALDPAIETDTRESLRRLITDIDRLPDQQRSALLMRELGGMSYCEVAEALDTSVPAIKSLLVRARMALLRAGEARDTACAEIRQELTLANDQGQRAGALARRHMRDCAECRGYRQELRGVHRNLAALVPAGPFALWSKLLGGGGASSGTGGGSAVLAGTGGATGGAGAMVGAKGVAAIIAAAIATTGGAVGLQHVLTSPAHPHPGALTHKAHSGSRGSAASTAGFAAGSSANAQGAATVSSQAGNPNYASTHRAGTSPGSHAGHNRSRDTSSSASGVVTPPTTGSAPPTNPVAAGGSGSTGAPTGAAGTTSLPSTTGDTGSGSSTGSTAGAGGSTSTGSTGSSQGDTPPSGAGGGTAGVGTSTGQTTGTGQAAGGGSGSGTAGGSGSATDTGSSGSTSGSTTVTGAGSTT